MRRSEPGHHVAVAIQRSRRSGRSAWVVRPRSEEHPMHKLSIISTILAVVLFVTGLLLAAPVQGPINDEQRVSYCSIGISVIIDGAS